MPTIDVRRAADRFTTNTDWLDSKHSFSFGHHYNADNVGHGLLLVNNDDVVRAGTGFDTHPHRDMEIVTWVLRGSLVHQDSTGHAGIIYPGLAQRMSAGTGILHSEKNDSWRLGGEQHDQDVHFVQMWVPPDTRSVEPGYEQLDITNKLGPVDAGSGNLVVVASGMDAHRDRRAISIRQRHAALHVARLQPGARVELPVAPFVHL
ncbi:MAG: pirin family protein, partial [Actinomycetes bacterium]